jgi:hypothetical protein
MGNLSKLKLINLISLKIIIKPINLNNKSIIRLSINTLLKNISDTFVFQLNPVK